MATIVNKIEKGGKVVVINRVQKRGVYMYYPALEDGRRTNGIDYHSIDAAIRVGKSFLDYVVRYNLAE